MYLIICKCVPGAFRGGSALVAHAHSIFQGLHPRLFRCRNVRTTTQGLDYTPDGVCHGCLAYTLYTTSLRPYLSIQFFFVLSKISTPDVRTKPSKQRLRPRVHLYRLPDEYTASTRLPQQKTMACRGPTPARTHDYPRVISPIDWVKPWRALVYISTKGVLSLAIFWTSRGVARWAVWT